MRRLGFYAKLAAGNLWRNKSTYLPYVLAAVVSIFTFYTMLSINMNGSLSTLRGAAIVQSFSAIGLVVLAVFCSLVIFYTNSFLIKRRKKELGLYSILGLEKRNIGMVMFFETLFISLFSFIIGILLGMLLSRLLFVAMLRLLQYDINISMPISVPAIGYSGLFFGVVFVLALLGNLRQVHIANPIELMSGAKQGEREPKSSWLLTLVGVLCLVGGYFIAIYFKTPMEAISLFFVAVFLVIIGTYCLFTAGSIAVLKLMRSNRKLYYHPKRFVSISGLIYRMKQNAAGLATICILSCMVLVTVSTTVSLKVGAEDSLRYQYPFEYRMVFGDDSEDGDLFLQQLQQVSAETNLQLIDLQDYRTIHLPMDEVEGTYQWSNQYGNDTISLTICLLEDYNASEGQNATLAADEVLLVSSGMRYSKESITLGSTSFAVHQVDEINRIEFGQGGIGSAIVVVLADEIVLRQLMNDFGLGEWAPSRNICFDLSGEAEEKAQFVQLLQENLQQAELASGHFIERESNREDWYITNGGFLFLGLYLGTIFMLAAALIIYYKQISEGYDDKERFDILQKVGMSAEEVRSTINNQIRTVFFLPLVIAIIHTSVAFWPISRILMLFGLVNIKPLLISTLATILVYVLVYLVIYRQTAKAYFRIVRRETASH